MAHDAHDAENVTLVYVFDRPIAFANALAWIQYGGSQPLISMPKPERPM